MSGHEGTEGNETADQPEKLGSLSPLIGPEPACGISAGIANKVVCDWTRRDHQKYRVLNRTQTDKGIPKRTLYQKNQEIVKTKQVPVTVGDSTTYGTCHLKGHLFKMGLTDNPICEKCLEKDESATHMLCDCEATAYLRFRELGYYFMQSGDYQDASARFILSAGLFKGSNRGGAQEIIEGGGAKEGLGLPLMQSFICGEEGSYIITPYFLTR
jgi:hypothetical protein